MSSNFDYGAQRLSDSMEKVSKLSRSSIIFSEISPTLWEPKTLDTGSRIILSRFGFEIRKTHKSHPIVTMCIVYHVTTRLPPTTVQKKQHHSRIFIKTYSGSTGLLKHCCMFLSKDVLASSLQWSVQRFLAFCPNNRNQQKETKTQWLLLRINQDLHAKRKNCTSQLHTSSQLECAIVCIVFLGSSLFYGLKSCQSVPWPWQPAFNEQGGIRSRTNLR